MNSGSTRVTTLQAFAAKFSSEAACAEHLASLRWPDGFRCDACDSRRSWHLSGRPRVFECARCGKQYSVTAGTVMHRTKVSLVEWFWAAWTLGEDKRGVSALRLSKMLGRRYETVWRLMHKLRTALGEDDSAFPLRGVVEVDECYLGAPAGKGHGGRSLKDHRRSLVVAAIERIEADEGHPGVRGTGLVAGAARFAVVPNAGGDSLVSFVKSVCAAGTTVVSDGWSGYTGLAPAGLCHQPVVVGAGVNASLLLPLVHTMFGNLQAWLNGTFHGVSRRWLPRYTQEFTWRFNRRQHAGSLWHYMLRRAVRQGPRCHAEVPALLPLLQTAA